MYFQAWQKFCQQQPLTDVEKQIAAVIYDHPEYHALFNLSPQAQEYEIAMSSGTSNPFLHLGMHLTLRDQIATDTPTGIRNIYQKLSQVKGDSLAAEHVMLPFLEQALWQAMQNNGQLDNTSYLENLHQIK
jgi:hypothetical protein